MNERKEKLIKQKESIESKINNYQGKLKVINQELKNIELQEKSKLVDEIINVVQEKGISDVKNANDFIHFIKSGKIIIK